LAIVEQSFVVTRRSNKPSLEKSYIENGGVVVNELQEVDFQRETVVEFGLGSQ